MEQKFARQRLFLIFLVTLNGFLTPLNLTAQQERKHTIYVAGPAALENPNWRSESKILYSILKRSAKKKGNTIELFPKESYRESIIPTYKESKRRRTQQLAPSRRTLEERYADDPGLYRELLELILVRRTAISELNRSSIDDSTSWDPSIHLKAYGLGGGLLLGLVESRYADVLGELVIFDADLSLDDIYVESGEAEPNVDSSASRNIIYINVGGNVERSCGPSASWRTTKKTVATVSAILTIVGAVVALI